MINNCFLYNFAIIYHFFSISTENKMEKINPLNVIKLLEDSLKQKYSDLTAITPHEKELADNLLGIL